MKNASLLFIFLMLSGCQAMVYGTASELNELRPGMSKAEVIQKLGDPDATSADADKKEEILTYRKMRGVVSWAPKLFDVILRDGKTVSWGEHR